MNASWVAPILKDNAVCQAGQAAGLHIAYTGTHPALNLFALQAIKLLHMTKVFGKSMRVNKASQDKDSADVGANLFIGNLDPDLDEKVSSDILSHL